MGKKIRVKLKHFWNFFFRLKMEHRFPLKRKKLTSFLFFSCFLCRNIKLKHPLFLFFSFFFNEPPLREEEKRKPGIKCVLQTFFFFSWCCLYFNEIKSVNDQQPGVPSRPSGQQIQNNQKKNGDAVGKKKKNSKN